MFALLFAVVLLCFSSREVFGFALPLAPGMGQDKLLRGMEWLQKYDYIKIDAGKDSDGLDFSMIKDGISKFQIFNSLPNTQMIDSDTIAQMEKPRCGCGDPEFAGVAERDEFRFGLEGGKWNKTELTYRITRIPKHLSKKTVRRTVRAACNVWSSRSPLRFDEVRSGRADINIKFMGTMDHGDRRAFWHPLEEVAHGFPPTHPELPGDIHLDASENYTFGDEEGIYLHQLLVHLLGHTLGLGHSPDPKSVMNPAVRPYDPEFALTKNDMMGLHSLYGRKKRDSVRRQRRHH
ncbi:matrilysin-like [Asterias rubens]|uniref:matrilysin-like n=1 Tax=Asterias rubens TaxID=7604 RepID=UPI001455B0F7|nr:matrilysin-like [Asterias rubens]